MRVLKTEEFFYVGGGDASDSTSGSMGSVSNRGESSDGSTNHASNSDKNACIARCSTTSLPSGNYGVRFWRCMNDCYNPLGGYNSDPYGPGGIYTMSFD